jgi:HSP20 family molecular chaperone IbpA
MMRRSTSLGDFVPSSPFKAPFLLGFERFGRSVDHARCGSAEGYPPYKLDRIVSAGNEPELLRLIFAVAGFAPQQLEISVADRQLSVRGDRRNEGGGGHFTDRGIAARPFQRTFRPAESVEAVEADLGNGLRSIFLSRRSPTASERTIKIGARTQPVPRLRSDWIA